MCLEIIREAEGMGEELTKLLALLLFIVVFPCAVWAQGDKPKPEDIFYKNINIEAGENVVGKPNRVTEVPIGVPVIYDFMSLKSAYNQSVVGGSVATIAAREKKSSKSKFESEGAGKGRSEGKVFERSGSAGIGQGVRLQGYCWFDRDYKVTVPQYVVLPCVVSTISGPEGVVGNRVFLRAKLEPQYQLYALVIKPIEIEDAYTHIFYPVDKSVIYDVATGSVNVADRVNMQMLKKALANGVLAFAQQASKGYEEYAKSKQKSNIYTGDTVVQEQNIPASYPATSAAIAGASAFVQSIVNIFQKKWETMPYIFEVYSGKKVFVDFWVSI